MIDRLLMLRGLARHQGHWCGFDEAVKERLGLEVHTLDLAGFGTEHERDAPTTIRATVEDLRARFEPGEKTGLLAISLGGMVAMDWVSTYPEEFAALVLINSSARNLGPFYERMQLPTFGKLLRVAATRDPVLRERRVLEATSEKRDDLEETAKKHAEFDTNFAPAKLKNVVKQLTAAIRYSAPEDLAPPTLVLASAGDRLAKHTLSERLAAMTGAQLHVHPSAGHDLPRDEPGWCIDQLSAFLQLEDTCGSSATAR